LTEGLVARKMLQHPASSQEAARHNPKSGNHGWK
jgi:hypothetical protein